MQIEGKRIGGDEAYIVAEIGNNHSGSLDTCKNLMDIAKRSGCDAVKLQKRDNASMYMKSLLNAPYDNENSYGDTYGAHREYLEFNRPQYLELQAYARQIGITFFATAFDENSAHFLHDLDVPAYKIASGDLTNIPLIKTVAKFGKPMILSTGGSGMKEITEAYNVLIPFNIPFAFLHCVATYPNKDEELNLGAITDMIKHFPCHPIGWSSHHPGIACNFQAYDLGARIFEVHITESRANKGTDHAFSLEPHGLALLVDGLRRMPVMRGHGLKNPLEIEKKALFKMAKAIHPSKSIMAGETLTDRNLRVSCPAVGLPPSKLDDVLGKVVICDLSTSDELKDEVIE